MEQRLIEAQITTESSTSNVIDDNDDTNNNEGYRYNNSTTVFIDIVNNRNNTNKRFSRHRIDAAELRRRRCVPDIDCVAKSVDESSRGECAAGAIRFRVAVAAVRCVRAARRRGDSRRR